MPAWAIVITLKPRTTRTWRGEGLAVEPPTGGHALSLKRGSIATRIASSEKMESCSWINQ